MSNFVIYICLYNETFSESTRLKKILLGECVKLEKYDTMMPEPLRKRDQKPKVISILTPSLDVFSDLFKECCQSSPSGSLSG